MKGDEVGFNAESFQDGGNGMCQSSETERSAVYYKTPRKRIAQSKAGEVAGIKFYRSLWTILMFIILRIIGSQYRVSSKAVT